MRKISTMRLVHLIAPKSLNWRMTKDLLRIWNSQNQYVIKFASMPIRELWHAISSCVRELAKPKEMPAFPCGVEFSTAIPTLGDVAEDWASL